MKTPPFFMATALVFWGMQSGFLLAAALIAAALEASRLAEWRWDLSDTELNRIWDLCSVLFIGTAGFFYATQALTESAFGLVQTFPFIFFPMMAAQAFGTRENIELRTFSWLLRDKEGPWLQKRLNVSWIYFSICLISSTATNEGVSWFYFGFAALAAAALWQARPRRAPALATALVIALAIIAGHFTHQKISVLQSTIESTMGDWIAGMFRRDLDTRESRTMIGRIGNLKLSGRILLRVEPEQPGNPPDLLREATYNVYRNSSWLASIKDFNPVLPGDTNDSWLLSVTRAPRERVLISGYLKQLNGILPLPASATELRRLPVAGLEQSPSGIVRVTEGPGLVRFEAGYGSGRAFDGSPIQEDSDLPDQEEQTFLRLAAALNLQNLSLDEKMRAIRRFFETDFSYSTWISSGHIDPSGRRTPLEMFLEETKSGHCEYFATATVLLLRAANVPARYAVGYSVQESDAGGKRYIVRERHGHAWCQVYRSETGAWESFDTTPADWNEVESDNASAWEPFKDFMSGVWFQFSKWRWGNTKMSRYLVWAVIPLMLILVWRIASNMRRQNRSNSGDNAGTRTLPGSDSEFYALERKLDEFGVPRASHETIRDWLRRSEAVFHLSPTAWTPAVALHYRYRFDPAGLTPEERQELRVSVRCLLDQIESVPRPGRA